MATINEIQDEIQEEYEALPDWMDRYALLIESGSELPALAESKKTPENLIDGCQSRVWISAELRDGRVHFEADSDALIVKGIIALLLRVLNDQTPADILAADLYFIPRIGFEANLSPTRANGLVAMLKQIKRYAIAFSTEA